MPLADELLGAREARALITTLTAADPGNPFTATRAASESLAELPLSGRARTLAQAMLHDIDGGPDRVTSVVRSACADPEFSGWMLWAVGLAVAWRAVDAGDTAAFDDGLAVLRELTPRMTSEFSVRPLLRHDLTRALDTMTEWTADPDSHVRRLASEGTRPLLPWGERVPGLIGDSQQTRPILDALYDDPDEVVRRSVANHLNDHSRAHADFAIRTVAEWQRHSNGHRDSPMETDIARTARHALRTLVKRGDAGALALLGFRPAELTVSQLVLTPTLVEWGGTVRFRGEIENVGTDPAELVIDYALHFPDARGGERSKIFKIAHRSLAPGERTVVEASRSFRPISTRRYYPGRHGIALQINGVAQERADFELLAPQEPAV